MNINDANASPEPISAESQPLAKSSTPDLSVRADKCGCPITTLVLLALVTLITRAALLPLAVHLDWIPLGESQPASRASDFWSSTDGYVVLAQNLVETHRFAFAPDMAPTVHRGPAFPAALAAAFHAVHSYPLATVLVNSLCAVLIVWCIYALSRRFYPKRLSFWIALAASFYPPALHYALTSWSETFLVASFMIYVVILLHTLRTGKTSWTILSGIALAALLLTKTLFIVIPVAAAAFGLIWRRRWLKPIIIQIALALALLAPWTVRNYRLIHQPTFVALGGGFNLIVGNFMVNHQGGCDEVFHRAMSDAFDYTNTQRGLTLTVGSVQSGGYFNVPPDLDRTFFELGLQQLRDQPSFLLHKMRINLLRFWYYGATPARCWLLLLINAPILLLAAWELMRQRRTSPDDWWLLMLILFSVWFAYSAIIVHSRFYLALIPLLLPFALARLIKPFLPDRAVR